MEGFLVSPYSRSYELKGRDSSPLFPCSVKPSYRIAVEGYHY